MIAAGWMLGTFAEGGIGDDEAIAAPLFGGALLARRPTRR